MGGCLDIMTRTKLVAIITIVAIAVISLRKRRRRDAVESDSE
jgi:hypothetical protein